MSSVDTLKMKIRSMGPDEAHRFLQKEPIDETTHFSEISKLMDYVPETRRAELIKLYSQKMPINANIGIDDLSMLFKRLHMEECLKTLESLEKRIDPNFDLQRTGRLLDLIKQDHRKKCIQILSEAVKNRTANTLLNVDELASIVSKISSNQCVESIKYLRDYVSKSLDFTRVRKILDVLDKSYRMPVLSELVSISTESPKVLKCGELSNLISAIPREHAMAALQLVSPMISPNLDFHKSEFVAEVFASADQFNAIQLLANSCVTKLKSFQEIRAVIGKLDAPYKAYEYLRPKFEEKDLDFKKVSTLLSVLPPMKRLDAILLTKEICFGQNQPEITLSGSDMRSILDLLEESLRIEALRHLKPLFPVTSENTREVQRILEYFSTPQRPIAVIILEGKNDAKTQVFPL